MKYDSSKAELRYTQEALQTLHRECRGMNWFNKHDYGNEIARDVRTTPIESYECVITEESSVCVTIGRLTDGKVEIINYIQIYKDYVIQQLILFINVWHHTNLTLPSHSWITRPGSPMSQRLWRWPRSIHPTWRGTQPGPLVSRWNTEDPWHSCWRRLQKTLTLRKFYVISKVVCTYYLYDIVKLIDITANHCSFVTANHLKLYVYQFKHSSIGNFLLE